MLRHYLLLIFQSDHVSSLGVFNILPGINFRLLFCIRPHLSSISFYLLLESLIQPLVSTVSPFTKKLNSVTFTPFILSPALPIPTARSILKDGEQHFNFHKEGTNSP